MSMVELLKWDTNFFGFSVAQIQKEIIHEKHLDEIFSFCKKNRVKLLQFKCDAHHRPSILLAESANFHFADVRMTLVCNLNELDFKNTDIKEDLSFRVGSKKDIPALKDIVTDLYTHSRYYFDTNFPRDDVHGFYQNWIEKSVKSEFDDVVYVLLNKHTHIGCCSVSYNSDNKASIGLFGIDPNSSGRGFGAILIHKVLSEMHKNDVKSVSVVTQGRNYLAQKLYQRAGFCNEKMEIYYHKWFTEDEIFNL
tara:strand:+ start:2419 stop:3171 length:753 start_codon:yes stop_codon:yes gene_type:complete